VLEPLRLSDHQHMFQVDLLGMRRRRDRIGSGGLRLYAACVPDDKESDQG